jgi:hypothetical protein
MALALRGSWAKSKPPIDTISPVGLVSPVKILMVVVFPAPFGPMNPNSSPCLTSKLRLSPALMEP